MNPSSHTHSSITLRSGCNEMSAGWKSSAEIVKEYCPNTSAGRLLAVGTIKWMKTAPDLWESETELKWASDRFEINKRILIQSKLSLTVQNKGNSLTTKIHAWIVFYQLYSNFSTQLMQVLVSALLAIAVTSNVPGYSRLRNSGAILFRVSQGTKFESSSSIKCQLTRLWNSLRGWSCGKRGRVSG